jgi:adenosylcobinamide-GDP ribazoletransferase
LGLSLRTMTGKTENGKPKGIMDQVRLRLDQLWVAIGFMTRLPVPNRDVPVAQVVWAFPVAGMLVGILSGAVLWGAAALGLSPLVAAFAALAVSALATGALHEDGLADCADGFWGGHTPQRRLEIMRDSRSGAYGVLALVLGTGIKAALIAQLVAYWGGYPSCMMVIAVHALARSGLPLAMMRYPQAAKTGLAAMVGAPRGIPVAASLILAGIITYCVLVLAPFWVPLVLIGTVCATALLMGTLAKAKLGGLNGDSLGATEQVSEIACFVMLAVTLGA